ncbi:D-amino-acid dehydrogenase [Aureimonas endophytica]|uniref:D-amino-acid dehydrogenase n=1 Tax=Aureimonas endophytica TaxID=2027858 RepID=A0A916ZIF2_9HYPH|nr:FAD-dependent oxidoreductase [Aureimonas endophytica]GGD98463.1 D-amino-acid dehydrogenase [Aureimonas endophytica]
MDADVAIVGAGVVGLATAHALLAEGRRVVIVERGEVAKGASFGNAGALAFSDVMPLASPGIMLKAPRWLMDPLGPLSVPPAYALGIAPWLFRFWRASSRRASRHSMLAQAKLMRLARAETLRLIERTGLGAMLVSDGALELYESKAELAAALPGWEARAREGIEFRHLEGAEIAALQPGLSPRFTHATFVPGWQSVSDPYLYALALAEAARERGAAIRQGEVTGFETAGETVTLRLADGARVTARQAVIACGAWSKALARGLGNDVPLDTERGYNTTLPPDSFDLKRQLTFGGHGFVVTRLSTGIRVGGAVELGGLALPPNFRRSEAMLAKAKAFLPGLRTEGGRQWMGFRPSMPDSLPVIGRSAASGDIVYAFGHGHLGLTQSAATGRLVADLLAGRDPAVDVRPFSPDRFR